jgi:hypothetical protein
VEFGDIFNDEVFDAMAAKYQIANLQLQLIESLKIQKIKERSYEVQCEEV